MTAEQNAFDINLQKLIDRETFLLLGLTASIKQRKEKGRLEDINSDIETCRKLIESIKFRKKCQKGLQDCKDVRKILKSTREEIIMNAKERGEEIICKDCHEDIAKMETTEGAEHSKKCPEMILKKEGVK